MSQFIREGFDLNPSNKELFDQMKPHLHMMDESKRWGYGHKTEWEYCEAYDCWFCYPYGSTGNTSGKTPGYMYCLGDRMFHLDFGYTAGDFSLTGSYIDNWHGMSTLGKDFDKAFKWLSEADNKELGPWLWGGKEKERMF